MQANLAFEKNIFLAYTAIRVGEKVDILRNLKKCRANLGKNGLAPAKQFMRFCRS